MVDRTLSSLADAIKTRRISPTEITREWLGRIERSNIRAFISVDDGAMSVAKELESRLRGGNGCGPLHGVPLAYKDPFFVAGMPAPCGTSKRDYFVAERTATAVSRLTAAEAVTRFRPTTIYKRCVFAFG